MIKLTLPNSGKVNILCQKMHFIKITAVGYAVLLVFLDALWYCFNQGSFHHHIHLHVWPTKQCIIGNCKQQCWTIVPMIINFPYFYSCRFSGASWTWHCITVWVGPDYYDERWQSSTEIIICQTQASVH